MFNLKSRKMSFNQDPFQLFDGSKTYWGAQFRDTIRTMEKKNCPPGTQIFGYFAAHKIMDDIDEKTNGRLWYDDEDTKMNFLQQEHDSNSEQKAEQKTAPLKIQKEPKTSNDSRGTNSNNRFQPYDKKRVNFNRFVNNKK